MSESLGSPLATILAQVLASTPVSVASLTGMPTAMRPLSSSFPPRGEPCVRMLEHGSPFLAHFSAIHSLAGTSLLSLVWYKHPVGTRRLEHIPQSSAFEPASIDNR